jgi:hypothetical protein
MDPNEIINILYIEGEGYLRNLAVPLTITLVIAYSLQKSIKNLENSRIRNKHKDNMIQEILSISHSFNEFLDMFHIRSKYDPDLIETLSDKISLQLTNLSGLSSVYFAKKKNIDHFRTQFTEIRGLYTKLASKKSPFHPVSPTEYVKFQEDFSNQLTELMKAIRKAKFI